MGECGMRKIIDQTLNTKHCFDFQSEIFTLLNARFAGPAGGGIQQGESKTRN